jgi:hypothetical protein
MSVYVYAGMTIPHRPLAQIFLQTIDKLCLANMLFKPSADNPWNDQQTISPNQSQTILKSINRYSSNPD